MSTPRPTPDDAHRLEIMHLGDALGFALELRETFVGDFCGLWLGDAEMGTVDGVVLTEERGTDVDRLGDYAVMARSFDPSLVHAVVWRTVEAVGDLDVLALEFFERRDVFDRSGIRLLDEIAIEADWFRSLAVSTCCDEPWWDEVSPPVHPALADDDR